MKYFLFILLVCFSVELRAQLKMGPQIGLGGTWTSLLTAASNGVGTGNNYNTREGGISYAAGLLASNRLSNDLSINAALSYGSARWKTISWIDSQDPIYFGGELTIYNYLNFSATINYFSTLGKGKIFLGAGGGLNYLLNGKVKQDIPDDQILTLKIPFKRKNGYDPDIYYRAVNRIQPLFAADMGYIFSNNIQILFSYKATLKDFYDEKSYGGEDATKTSLLMLSVCYLLEVKKKKNRG